MEHQGLSSQEVIRLRNKFGENILPQKEKVSPFSIFINQFKSPLIYILLFAALVSLFFREYFDVILIMIVILLDVLMGFYQEYKAQKTLEALRNILEPTALVLRDGQRKEINVSEIVPGDLVFLGSGDKVPADGKLIEGTNILIDEAILTGEAEAREKKINSKDNLLFMGTIVLAGSGAMQVKSIGTKTEIGKIGKSLEIIEEEETPLQKKLNHFAKNLAWFVAILCLIIFIVGFLFQDRNVWEMLRTAIVLAVAAIPGGLPIAVTVVMAIGMYRILQKKGLVKRLISIETLGSTMVICTDKTGTLTEGKMEVAKTDFTDEKNALLAIILDNDERTNMEICLLNYAKTKKMDVAKIAEKFPRILQEPFSSETKTSYSVNDIDGEKTAFMLGAPEIVVKCCQLSKKNQEEIIKKVYDWANSGLRIIAIAYKDTGTLAELEKKQKYHWLGLIGIRDPLRHGVREVVAEATRAGIQTKIVTGDYLGTALKVASEIGLRTGKENVLEGSELEKISDVELGKIIDDIDVFARITPNQKLKIIKVLQDKDETVAMTGDGVNDAPALKKADIGVVVGRDASEVAKETGDLILLDGNFKTIIAAVEEGRLVFSNIRKVVAYMLSNSFAAIALIFGAMILDLPAPLTIVQILWINLICDGPPDLVLSFEPKEKHLMREKPERLKKEEFLGKMSKTLIAVISLLAGLSALGFFWFIFHKTQDIALAQTVAFVAIGIISLIYIFSFKSFDKSLFKTENFWQNKYLIWGVVYGWVLLLAAIYLPVLNKFIGTVPLSWTYWVLILAWGAFITVVVELIKLFYHSRKKYY